MIHLLKQRAAKDIEAGRAFLASGDYLSAALRFDQVANACLALGGFSFEAHAAARETLAEIDDITAHVKPDRDSESGGTVVERVRVLVELSQQ